MHLMLDFPTFHLILGSLFYTVYPPQQFAPRPSRDDPKSQGRLDPILESLREGVFEVGWIFCFQKCLVFPPWVSINVFFAVYKGLAALVSCLMFVGGKIFLIEKNVKNQMILWEAKFLFNLERTLSREQKFSWPPRNP